MTTTKEEQKIIQVCELAKRGWHVFPCKWFGDNVKAPVVSKGFYDATIDINQIIDWWTEKPKALIGVRTGEKSGIWAVDVDEKGDRSGMQSLMEKFPDLDLVPEPLIQRTASGGYHFIYKWNEDRPVTIGKNLLPGIDIRGEGGYIVVAPSGYFINDEWSEYKWKDFSIEPHEAPEWAYTLAKLISSGNNKTDLEKAFTGLSQGERDNGLIAVAGMCHSKDIPFELAVSVVEYVALKCTPPMSIFEAREKTEYAYTRFSNDDPIKEKIKARFKNV